ncbi:MAG: hypothetical protein JNK82_03820 [Myxococcaceae bacterium]|nr:hypothetical protein [Myxococcaceae bacterium]
MTALKNAAHLAVLSLWAIAGMVFTAKLVFAAGPVAFQPVLLFWAWFAGFAALTTFIVSKLKGTLATLGIHAAAVFVMQLLPKAMPFVLMRIGVDFLAG